MPIDVNENDFLDVMLILGKYGVHRAWLVDGDQITNVVTQTGLLEVLANYLASFAGLTHKTIASLDLGTPKHVISATLSDTVRAYML